MLIVKFLSGPYKNCIKKRVPVSGHPFSLSRIPGMMPVGKRNRIYNLYYSAASGSRITIA